MTDYTEIVQKAKVVLAQIADYMALPSEDKRLNKVQMYGVCFSEMPEIAAAVVEMAEERQELEAQLATARKLIQGARRLHKNYLPAHWQEDADQFLKETEPR